MKLTLSYFLFLIFLFLLSCAPKTSEVEYIEFEHKCTMLRKSDKVFLRIFPEIHNGNERISVQLNYHGKEYATRFVSRKNYEELVKSIVEIKDDEAEINEVRNELGEKPVVITRTDGGYSSIEFRKGNFVKKKRYEVLNDEGLTLQEAVSVLSKVSGLDIKGIK
jgi:hypothetical protein